MEVVILAAIGIICGAVGSTFYYKHRSNTQKNRAEQEIATAKTRASDIVLKAKDDALAIENDRRKEWSRTEQRLGDREKTLDAKLVELDNRSEKLRSEEQDVEGLKDDIRVFKTETARKIGKNCQSDQKRCSRQVDKNDRTRC